MRHFNHGDLLIGILKDNQMTKSEFARKAGVSRQLVHHWCNADALSFKNIDKICETLHIHPYYFLVREYHDKN
tara:strand:+ start:298 stop:516 length:219 start_codon:yes stop_codon:yes gene_type:complete